MLKHLLSYQLKVPIIQLVERDHLLWLESAMETKEQSGDKTHVKREQRFMKEAMPIYLKQPREIQRIIGLSRYYARIYRSFMNRIITAIHCEQLHWKISYGSKDAAMTGIMAGLFGSVQAMVIGRLRKRVTFISRPVVQVRPIFGKTQLEIDFGCIFSIRLGNVITAMKSIFYSKTKEVTNSG
jgi:hypothetical protein